MKSVIASALVFAGILGFAPLAQAATYTETTDYSSVAATPTLIGTGYDTVSGTLVSGDWDYLAIDLTGATGLVTLNFLLANTSILNGAGFQLYYSYSPFSDGNNSYRQPNNQWVTQTVTPASVDLSNWSSNNPTSANYSIAIEPDKGTVLYLALNGTFNTAQNGGIAYNVSVPQTVLPAVPLPATGALMLSALGLAAFAGRRKTR